MVYVVLSHDLINEDRGASFVVGVFTTPERAKEVEREYEAANDERYTEVVPTELNQVQ